MQKILVFFEHYVRILALRHDMRRSVLSSTTEGVGADWLTWYKILYFTDIFKKLTIQGIFWRGATGEL